ncbi:MAG: single-stranded-DNA-specific exonuclease RecJ [Flavobacteriales bacterium]|nr:single-stranded-DNA-specific exonuclease RecJ [Flavobacteriales bacterium]
METRWIINKKSNPEKINELSASLNNLDLTLTDILIQRGIDTFEKAKSFFRPSLDEIHDPFLMKDMDKAVNRLQQAIDNNEKILVFGDYDVDGTTSVALVYSYLKNYYQNLEYYIPDRYTEGYGISYQGIDYAAENNFKLIIALDCGIKAIEKIDYATEKAIDFIICDHHRPGDTIPKAVAVLDQKRADCNYPYKELSGCGVGFKLMQAWTKQTEKDEAKLFEYLDLLAISTCADIVPITGENRVFVYYGLKVINENPRLGVKTLIDLTGKKKDLTSTDVVFTIAPRINAAGRIETGNKAVEMLVEENKTSALGFGKNINELNTDRKDLDRDITAEALAMIEENTLLQTKKTTVLYQENWHKGVIGIVASRLIETHYRPTIILTESNGKATGSARSVKDFDIYNAIDACSDLLEQFGGHKYAAGLTMKLENLDAFIEKFEEVVNDQIDDDLLIPQVNIDAKLELNQINDKFYSILKQFAPTGPSNMRPVFMSENVFSTSNSRIVGDNHLKLEVFQEENPDLRFACIAFNMGYLLDEIAEGVPFSIVYNIEENTWNGNTTLQLSIKDLKV